jgi:hypothetical protein
MLQRLCKYTFFTRISLYDTLSNITLNESFKLNEILNLISVKSSIKCKCRARIFNYFTVNNPLITFINVYCKSCNYQNSLPFHFVNVYEPTIASKLYLIDNYDDYICDFSTNQDIKSYLYKQNFNLDWLFEAKPSNIVTISNEKTKVPLTSFYYNCPRCFWLNKKLNKLDYVYRFAFTLIDESKFKLSPCLLENKSALEYVGNIDPLEFCCLPEQANKVTDLIFNMFNKEALFELECINNEKDESVSEKERLIFKINRIEFLV